MNGIFTGDYCFFDYKHNIPGYEGQDYGGFPQYFYLVFSLAVITVLLILLRKTPKEKVRKIVGFLGLFIMILDITKISWESYYDIKMFGEFNYYILPLDTCSFIVPAAIIAGFCRGKIQKIAECWIATGGVIGGIAAMLFLNAFKFYPFLSFGAFYSMIWHFLMVFMGLLIIVTSDPPIKYSIVTNGFLFHLAASAITIPVDFIFGFDFMLYRDLGGVPFFEGVASSFTEKGLAFLNPVLMLALYFAMFSVFWLIYAGLKNRKKKVGEEAPTSL